MIIFSHIRNTPNTGDMASCPAQYFDFPKHRVLNYDESFPETVDAVIYGGGTMVNWLNGRKLPNTKLIGWGMGSSRHNTTDPWPDPQGFALLGVREWMEANERAGTYVPCVSCMHPLFDEEYEIEHEAVVFVNASDGIKSRYPVAVSGLPVMDNSRPLKEIVAFLGSAKTVITNSYHGVFWTSLLERRCICLPYSSKFYWFKYPPAYSLDGGLDWKSLDCHVQPGVLDDCRALNRAFYERVLETIG